MKKTEWPLSKSTSLEKKERLDQRLFLSSYSYLLLTKVGRRKPKKAVERNKMNERIAQVVEMTVKV